MLLKSQGGALKVLKYGDTFDGTVLHVGRDELVVDIGAKSEGVVAARDMQTLTDDERDALVVGAQVLVFVLQPEDDQGRIALSLDRARQERSWRRLHQIADEAGIIEAVVVNYNKGGLLVNLDGVRGFIPTSQVSGVGRGNEAQKQAHKLPRILVSCSRGEVGSQVHSSPDERTLHGLHTSGKSSSHRSALWLRLWLLLSRLSRPSPTRPALEATECSVTKGNRRAQQDNSSRTC
jgi:predicted RNA-binding protein with RPS1 domain